MANEIKLYFHCGKCLDEKPEGISPCEWQQIQAGWTLKGFQVWCKRHDINIVHMDLKGQKIYEVEENDNG